MKNRIIAATARALEVPESSLDESASAETLEAWDSLGHVAVMLEIEQEFGVQFATEELEHLTSIDKIHERLQQRVAA
jgi:acyl carrier protein